MSTVKTEEAYDATLSLLTQDIDGSKEQLLWEIVQWEKQHPPETEEQAKYWGWEWFSVHADSRVLKGLVQHRILDVVYQSNKSTTYRAADLDAIERALRDYQGTLAPPEEEKEIPPDLMDIIVGHEDKKFIIKRCLNSPRPVHALLFGSIGSAKTLMLEELSRLPRSHFVLGSSLTKAGLFEVLFTERPTYLILDELDKIDDTQNLAALLSLMERGTLSETKYKRHPHIKLTTWVFASANKISRIPPELMSRFLKLHFHDYDDTEFVDVSVRVLKEREGVPESLSLFIAQEVLRKLGSRDVRDCIRIARLLKEKSKEEISHLVEIMMKQK